MPGGGRKTEPALKQLLLDEAHRFGFFQLVHLLETWQGRPVEIGKTGPYQDEGLRLRPWASLAFPPGDVLRVEADTRRIKASGRPTAEPEEEASGGTPLQMTVSFMGLYGPASPTPVYFTELLAASSVDTRELRDLLDIFNHRLLSLYYRAWQKYRFPYRYRAGGLDQGGRDLLSFAALSFAGLGEAGVRRQAQLPVARLTGYLGLLGPRSRPPVNLELLLADYFDDLPVRIQPWMLRWVSIPQASCCRLGAANSSLGQDLTIGEEVPDRASKFRVSVGPLSYDDYQEFLPGSANFRQLCGLVGLWAGGRYEYDVEFILRRDKIPRLELGKQPEARLGWTSWVTSTKSLGEDPSVVFAAADSPVETGPAEEEAA